MISRFERDKEFLEVCYDVLCYEKEIEVILCGE